MLRGCSLSTFGIKVVRAEFVQGLSFRPWRVIGQSKQFRVSCICVMRMVAMHVWAVYELLRRCKTFIVRWTLQQQYLHCHKFEVACGVVVLIVTFVCMMSSETHMKAWEWSRSAIR